MKSEEEVKEAFTRLWKGMEKILRKLMELIKESETNKGQQN